MRKSFELLDWMKEHFKGDGGKPSVLYKFTNGLKEQDGTVSVDAGNGVSVNEHTKMLEVPIGEHLSYTSQGIDAKEGDTAQKGVVQLTDAIEAHADHTTAATPAAVKEYVDANVVIGGGEGKTYTFQEPLAEHLGAVSVADASKSAKGVVKLASEMTDAANPATAADVKAYVDAKPSGGIDLSEDRAYNGSGTFQVATTTDTQMAASGITVGTVDKTHLGAIVVTSKHAQLGVVSEKVPTSLIVQPNSVTITPNDHTPGFKVTDKGVTFDKFKVITEANLADEQNLGVVKLTHTVSHGEHPNEAVTPDGVAAYVGKELYSMPTSPNITLSWSGTQFMEMIGYTASRIGNIVFVNAAMRVVNVIAGLVIGEFTLGGVKIRSANSAFMAPFDTGVAKFNVLHVSNTKCKLQLAADTPTPVPSGKKFVCSFIIPVAAS